MELPKPDIVLYMDIDLEVCLAQMKARQAATNTTGDIHETNVDYLRRCLLAGHAASERLGWSRIRCLSPDGSMRSISDIHEDIYDSLKGVL